MPSTREVLSGFLDRRLQRVQAPFRGATETFPRNRCSSTHRRLETNPASVHAGVMANRQSRDFTIKGVIVEEETGRPLPDLIVRAFDRDLIFDDIVGYSTTDDDGRFTIQFGREQFRDLWESRPDLYLRIYDRDGIRLIHETTDSIRWNASGYEVFRLRVPARALDPRIS